MPNRIIKESIRTSRSVNTLSDFDFRVWIYLITYVDDYGRGSAEPDLIKGLVFPRRKGITEKQITNALSNLAESGMIALYMVGEESYFCFPNWGEHQRIRTKVSKFPSPDEGNDVTKGFRQSAASCGNLPQDAARIQNPESRIQNPNKDVPYGTSSANCEFAAVVERWNALPEPIPKVKGIPSNGTRRNLLKARIGEYGVEAVLGAIDSIRESDFLQGKTGENGFIIKFDWFIRPNNFAKVLEGNYLDKKAKGAGDAGNAGGIHKPPERSASEEIAERAYEKFIESGLCDI